MSADDLSRREFLKQNSLAGLGVAMTSSIPTSLFPNTNSAIHTPVILGGKPVLTAEWIKWPMWKPETDERSVVEVLRSGVWSRENVVTEFEKKWAETIGTKRCLAVVNGTNSMIISLTQLNIGGGDEVILPSYTFIATALAVLATGAMPVFVDTDPETFQFNSNKIEEKITPRTRAILPVHLAGIPVDMAHVMDIAQKHKLHVIEDACQAHLAEYDHKKVGTFGDAGCFSFQNSKNLPIGEGGAIMSNDEQFIDRCYAYHNFGQAYGSVSGSGSVVNGSKLRMAEYQAAIGLVQLQRLESQTATRTENANYLQAQMKNIPGILPYSLYEKVTRASYHFFPFRYKKEFFKDLPREKFLDALGAEGVPCFGGYGTLHDRPFLEDAFKTKNFKKMYPAKMLDIKRYTEMNRCPETERLCNEEAIWLPQNVLLSGKTEMDGIIAAIDKISKNAGSIKNKT